MITNINSTTDTSAAAAAMKSSVGMNSDDFMKLFVAQLQYQDPLAPQDPSAMLNQLSQLSMVEQSYNTNTDLANLITAQSNATDMSAVSFIGKTVTANGNSINCDGSLSSNITYNLGSAADTVAISVSDSSGNVVRNIAAGAQSSGDQSYTWDGKDSSGTMLPAGAYTFSVTASNSGSSVTTTAYTSGTVSGVSLSSDSPVLTVGAVTIPLTDVIRVL